VTALSETDDFDTLTIEEIRAGLNRTFRRHQLLKAFGKLNDDAARFTGKLAIWSQETCSDRNINSPAPCERRLDGSHYDTQWLLYLIGGAEQLIERFDLPDEELRTLIAGTWYISNLDVSAQDARLIYAEVGRLMAKNDCDSHGLRESGSDHMQWWLKILKEPTSAEDHFERPKDREPLEPMSYLDICIVMRDGHKEPIH